MRKANVTGLLASCLITMTLLFVPNVGVGAVGGPPGSGTERQGPVGDGRILLAAENKSECEARKRACYAACQDKPSTCEGPRCVSPQAQCLSPCQWIKCQ
ncbi:MAG: hypothetical protein H7835_14740 [Magnetococcus sp. XQGC-1]